ncbi:MULTISPECIES: L-fucose:H+ symporter permease [Cellulophaga]|uniref:L-fucose transporter n=2 Tax=Cellulophaga TaxID=104264 RepID=F0RIC5_CELLC|nr:MULTISPECIES: L-fucose:H+ symporter permease [Cellulophaga]ADY28251.1 L-fucose transporter [Cellulophaga lytica DSM 7489]EWH13665.1 L-fucose transporter [Cellulophaga geojensis KL-A]TVZ09182.1 FHS family L-fucose permease-like MFS transporter [Cellulophaga sp. RHA_52]WQG77568.1 L-fucose:H+ symporter permease [Cellulophaga lytica]
MNSTNNKPIVKKELLFPFIMITSLFALWGIANDLTNPMVSAFKKVMPELSNMQASLVQFAFYFGYFFMALPAALFIRKYSYKSGIVLGLCLYAIGAFLFYPAAAFQEFNYFLISLWVITCGLAFLETTSNPLILSLGAKETATQRLNLAQAFNPIGSLIGMIVAQQFVISALRSDDKNEAGELIYDGLSSSAKAVIRENDLSVISVPYIILGVVVLCIMAIILFIKIPKSVDGDKMSISDSFKKLFSNKNYIFGVIAQAFYVGAQIMCWTYIFQYVDNINEGLPANEALTATWYNVAAMVIFLTGRWIGTALMKTLNPSRVLLLFGLGGVLFSAGAILLQGQLGLYSLVGISLFMSIMFPTIYGIALKDMGDEAKIGSAGLVMAIVGGALMPVLQGGILDWGGPGFSDVKILGFIPEINFSFILPLICLSVVTAYGYVTYKSSKKI